MSAAPAEGRTFGYMPLEPGPEGDPLFALPVIDIFEEPSDGSLPGSGDLVTTVIGLPDAWPSEGEIQAFYNDLAGDVGWEILWDSEETQRVTGRVCMARVPMNRKGATP